MQSEPNSESHIEVQTHNEGLIKDKYEALLKEAQSIISIFYILAVAIGMLFNYQKYSEFGINIFDYADIFEFLVAPFSDITILFFTFGSCLIAYFIYRFDLFIEKKYPKIYLQLVFGLNKKSYYNLYRYLSFIFLFLYYLYGSADFYGELAAEKTKEQTPISLRFVDNEVKKGIIIGNTKQVIFFLEGKKVKAIPFTALVKEFEIKK
ncbi:hypothetical protein V9L05_15445 [Bernardetia sp. Wsw4-3y2]|uniref:hypothetical protein n=1 Tax=unclassified Bernardetia TaxID=2647129 RepID=UPI0030D3354A